MNVLVLSKKELFELIRDENYTVSITDNKTNNKINIGVSNKKMYEDKKNKDKTTIDFVKKYLEDGNCDNVSDDVGDDVGEEIENNEEKYEDNFDYDAESESELEIGIDSEIDNDYNTKFSSNYGGPYEINFDNIDVVNEYVLFKLISVYIDDVSVFIKRKKLLSLYDFYNNSNPYDEEDIHGDYKYFFKIEKYVGHRLKREIADKLCYQLNMPGLVDFFYDLPINLFNTFDISKLFKANTTNIIRTFYAYM